MGSQNLQVEISVLNVGCRYKSVISLVNQLKNNCSCLENEYDEFSDDPTAFLFQNGSHAPQDWQTSVNGDNGCNVALISGALAYANYMNACK